MVSHAPESSCNTAVFTPKSKSFPVLRYNIYTYEGSDLPWVVESGRLQNNIFSANVMIGAQEAIKLAAADGTEFTGNVFSNPTKIRFQGSTDTVISGNTGLDLVELKLEDDACFDASSDAAFIPVC